MERNFPPIGNTRRRIDKDCIGCGERFSQTVRKLDYAQGRKIWSRCEECRHKRLAGLLDKDIEKEDDDAPDM